MSPHRRTALIVPSLLLLLLVLVLVAACTTPGSSRSSSSFVLGFNLVRHQQQQLRLRRHARLAAAALSSPVHQRQPLLPLSSTTNDHVHDLDATTDESSPSSSSSPKSHSSSCDDDMMNRRLALEQITFIGGMALSSLLLSSTTADAASSTADNKYYVSEDDTKKKRILITGSNSGIGLDAAQRMALRGHEVVLACRSLEKAIAAADTIITNIANNAEDAVDANSLLKSLKLTPMECNLADLSSIDAFVNNLTTTTTTTTNKKENNNNNNTNRRAFDAVCYNAGIARNIDAKDVARTKEGFELTVGTNHLGHFYLNHLLLNANLINNNNESDDGGGRIVVTSSSVHDPESPGGAQGATATLGDLRGLEYAVSNGSRQFDMVDGGPFNADKAYKDSKLCNILFVRELQRRLDRNDNNNKIKVNCFTPGLIVGTGLFRDQNQVFTKVFDIAATNILKVGETTHYGGGALEYMTLSTKVGEKRGGLYYFSPPGSSKYGDDAFGKQFDVGKVSKEAQESDSNGKAKRLWELSERLVGIGG